MSTMSTHRTGAAALVIMLLVSGASATGQDRSADAKRSAEGWLSLIDNGDYDGSWASAATYFKKQVTDNGWRDAMNGVRVPLGRLQSRTLAAATAATTLPGAPDGEYRVFQFDTSFEHKQTAVETVTAVLETDGNWRIAGYFIR